MKQLIPERRFLRGLRRFDRQAGDRLAVWYVDEHTPAVDLAIGLICQTNDPKMVTLIDAVAPEIIDRVCVRYVMRREYYRVNPVSLPWPEENPDTHPDWPDVVLLRSLLQPSAQTGGRGRRRRTGGSPVGAQDGERRRRGATADSAGNGHHAES
jgi:hypothetical protein